MNAGEILNSTYEIQEKIGAGGGGTVYKAYHKRLQKEVVLKKIHKSTARNEEEKEILKNLKHSYLPLVYDFLDADDGVFTIIDYIPGQSLDKLVKDNKPVPVRKVVRYGIQLCEVVAYLHGQKQPIVHGDIKPANIMLTPEDNICLIDFNISGVLEGNSMMAAGYTPGYAPPEQAASFWLQVDQLRHEEIREERKKRARMNDASLCGVGKATALLEEGSEATALLEEGSEATALLEEGGEATALLEEGGEATALLQENENVTEPLQECTGKKRAFREKKSADPAEKQITYEDVTCRIDVRSDIYSIGATLYHLLTGVQPSENPAEIKKPSELNPEIGESISLILMKAMAAKPEDRFQTVGQMLDALRKIHKYDFRYKKMIVKQELTFLFSVLCVAAGIVLTFFGKEQIAMEKEDAYVQAVTLLTDAVNSDSEAGQVEELYAAAQQMKPKRLEAYLQKALFLYQEREFEECRRFIEDTILNDSSFSEQEGMADVYFILGNCYFEQEAYAQAIVDYRTAISRNDANPDYYRDYVIALVRDGQAEAAKEALAQAGAKGISSIDLLLIHGELNMADGAYEEAEQNFKECIAETQNDDLRMRAYIMCDMVYRKMSDRAAESGDGKEVKSVSIENLQKSAALLEDARTKVGLENQLLVYEHLAQSYIDLEELTSDVFYGEKATGVLQDIIDHGWGNYTTYNNMAILYQKTGQTEQAETVLAQMQELDPENYTAFKCLALLEVEKQNKKKNEERAYDKFLTYYKEAKKLYETSPAAGGDTEMQLLDSLHQQLIDGGWLK